MDKIDNAIESAYRALAENLSKDNILLYSEVPDPKLQIVFSTLHTTINWTCERMSDFLPAILLHISGLKKVDNCLTLSGQSSSYTNHYKDLGLLFL